ncbi:MAG: hypothetical protein L7F78_24275, partial [Syntrophales bacterium LBB04]|nr:hypothetical protein [Syntrophales bacterium LBB04]
RFAGFELIGRLIVGTVSIIPFMCVISIVIAEEVDEIRIQKLGRKIYRQLSSAMDNDSIKACITELAQQ